MFFLQPESRDRDGEVEGVGDRFSRFLSNDSSFYGDEETKARLEARAANFDPAPYWESHEHQFHVVAAKAQEEHEEKKKAEEEEKARAKAEEEEDTKAKVREQQSTSATGLNLPGKAMTGSQSEPPHPSPDTVLKFASRRVLRSIPGTTMPKHGLRGRVMDSDRPSID